MSNLEKLCGLPGVSGDEKEVRDYLIGEYQSRNLEIIEDRLGSVFGKRAGSSNLNVMISSNMDESGLMISDVREDGLIEFLSIGLFAKASYHQVEVTLLGRRHEKTQGIVVKENSDFLIDAGFGSKEEAKKAGVIIGNFVVVSPVYKKLGSTSVLSNNLANRAGIDLGLNLLEATNSDALDFNLVVGGISHSVVGQRGAITATSTVKPDLAIVIDLAYIKDAKEDEIYIRNFDKSLLPNQLLKNRLYDVAEGMNLKPKAHITDAHSDGSFIHKSLSGTPTIVLVVPVKHNNEIYNVLNLSHLDTMLSFVREFLKTLTHDDIKTMQYNRGNRYE